MTLLWTKSHLPTGTLITWALDEPCSHFAIMFGDAIVLHSNFAGVHVENFSGFARQCDIIFKKKYDLSLQAEADLLLNIMRKYLGKSYDWKWFFSLCYYGLMFKLFGKEIPVKIRWQSDHKFLCTEMAEALSEEIGPVDIGNGSPYLLAVQLGAISDIS